MSFIDNAKSMFDTFSSKLDFGGNEEPAQTEGDQAENEPLRLSHQSQAISNKFQSFAPPRTENDAKWFVDGCGYMWAVSVAIEEAQESIWILDWWLSPELYLRRPPSKNEEYRLDRMLLAAAERGVKVNIIIYKEVSLILPLYSEHSKKALEVHPNIAVFRHPDHVPCGQAIGSEFASSLKGFSMKPIDLIQLPIDGLSALYGASEDVILYWAHHEKLCLIDNKIAFMGGLDLCFGRWDTNSHPIADAHPTDLEEALFPGQDFNNARVYDFADVANYEINKLDRTKSSRMGWTDISLCLRGSVVEDLRAHFVQRWNFIFKEKYEEQDDERYSALVLEDIPDGYYREDGTNIKGRTAENQQAFEQDSNGMNIQLVRSCAKWSNGCATEHSIQNAYIETIRNSQHFVYIENQFFITATDDHSGPVKNRIGQAIVERIVRAHREGQRYKVIVLMPAVPGFAGDLHADDSLGARAIMEYQYHSICRGGHSIMDAIQKAGVPEAKDYIRFYNLRSYDRINKGATMAKIENESGVSYEDARREHDDIVGAGYGGRGEETGASYERENERYESYQWAAGNVQDGSRNYDSVSECYMDGGPSIKEIPWSGSEEAEIDAFVSEELYIHSKLLIADDRIVICGSANLNDRSQLGNHDSEIAVIIQDTASVDSLMSQEPFQASAYASSLRRQIFRKHLGLLPSQDCTRPDANFTPIDKGPNSYDWDSPADLLVKDVLSEEFERLWNETARVNTEVFGKAFHCIPADNVRTWEEYEDFFGRFFTPKAGKNREDMIPAQYEYGHVVKEEFEGGVQELKDCLDRVRGNLVEMPLLFMDGVDFAEEGLKLNAFTDDVYT